MANASSTVGLYHPIPPLHTHVRTVLCCFPQEEVVALLDKVCGFFPAAIKQEVSYCCPPSPCTVLHPHPHLTSLHPLLPSPHFTLPHFSLTSPSPSLTSPSLCPSSPHPHPPPPSPRPHLASPSTTLTHHLLNHPHPLLNHPHPLLTLPLLPTPSPIPVCRLCEYLCQGHHSTDCARAGPREDLHRELALVRPASPLSGAA